MQDQTSSGRSKRISSYLDMVGYFRRDLFQSRFCFENVLFVHPTTSSKNTDDTSVHQDDSIEQG